MSEPTPSDELAAFQAALARLTPAPDGINIAQLLFRAGQLSAPRRSWVWPCATAASVLLTVALGAVLLLRQPVDRVVTIYVPAAPQVEPSVSASDETPAPPPSLSGRDEGDGDYLQLRRQVLAHGLGTLPPPQPWPAAIPADDTDTLLDLPRDSREPWLLRLKHSLHSGGPS